MADDTRPSQLQQLYVLQPTVVLKKLTAQDINKVNQRLLEDSLRRGSQVWLHTRSTSSTANAVMPSSVLANSTSCRRSSSGSPEESRDSMDDPEWKVQRRKRVISFGEHRRRDDEKRRRLSRNPSPPAVSFREHRRRSDEKRRRLSRNPSPPATHRVDKVQSTAPIDCVTSNRVIDCATRNVKRTPDPANNGANGGKPVAVPANSGATTVGPIASTAPARIAAKARISTDAKRPKPDRRKSREMLSAMEDKETGCLFSPDVVTTHYARRPSHGEGAIKPTGKLPADVDTVKHSSEELRTCSAKRPSISAEDARRKVSHGSSSTNVPNEKGASQRGLLNCVKSGRPDAVAQSSSSDCGPVTTTPGERNGTVVTGKITPLPRPSLEKDNSRDESNVYDFHSSDGHVSPVVLKHLGESRLKFLIHGKQPGSRNCRGRDGSSGRPKAKSRRFKSFTSSSTSSQSNTDSEPEVLFVAAERRRRDLCLAKIQTETLSIQHSADSHTLPAGEGKDPGRSPRSGNKEEKIKRKCIELFGSDDDFEPTPIRKRTMTTATTRVSESEYKEAKTGGCVMSSLSTTSKVPTKIIGRRKEMGARMGRRSEKRRLAKRKLAEILSSASSHESVTSVGIVKLVEGSEANLKNRPLRGFPDTSLLPSHFAEVLPSTVPFRKITENPKLKTGKPQAANGSIPTVVLEDSTALTTTVLGSNVILATRKASNKTSPMSVAPIPLQYTKCKKMAKEKIIKEKHRPLEPAVHLSLETTTMNSTKNSGEKSSTKINLQQSLPAETTCTFTPLIEPISTEVPTKKKEVFKERSNTKEGSKLPTLAVEVKSKPIRGRPRKTISDNNYNPLVSMKTSRGQVPKKLVAGLPKSNVQKRDASSLISVHRASLPLEPITSSVVHPSNISTCGPSKPHVLHGPPQGLIPKNLVPKSIVVSLPLPAVLQHNLSTRSDSIIPVQLQVNKAPLLGHSYSTSTEISKPQVSPNVLVPKSSGVSLPLPAVIQHNLPTPSESIQVNNAPLMDHSHSTSTEIPKTQVSPNVLVPKSSVVSRPLPGVIEHNLPTPSESILRVQLQVNSAPLMDQSHSTSTEIPKLQVSPNISQEVNPEKSGNITVEAAEPQAPFLNVTPKILVSVIPKNFEQKVAHRQSAIDQPSSIITTGLPAPRILCSAFLDVPSNELVDKLATRVPLRELATLAQVPPTGGQVRDIGKSRLSPLSSLTTAEPLVAIPMGGLPPLFGVQVDAVAPLEVNPGDGGTDAVLSATEAKLAPKATVIPPAALCQQAEKETTMSVQVLQRPSLDNMGKPVVTKVMVSALQKATSPIVGRSEPIATNWAASEPLKATSVLPPTSPNNRCKPIVTKTKVPELQKATTLPLTSMDNQCNPVVIKVTASEHSKATSVHPPISQDNRCKPIVTKRKAPELPKAIAITPPSLDKPVATKVTASENPNETALPLTSLDIRPCQSTVTRLTATRIFDDLEMDESREVLPIDNHVTRQQYNAELQNALRFVEDIINNKATVMAPLVVIPAGNLESLKAEPEDQASDVCKAHLDDAVAPVSFSAGSVDGCAAVSSVQVLGNQAVATIGTMIPARATNEIPGIPAVKTSRIPSVPCSNSVTTPTEPHLLSAAVQSPSPCPTLPDVPIDETCVDFERLLSSHLVDVSTFASSAEVQDPSQKSTSRRRRTVSGGLESPANAEMEPSSPPLPPPRPEATKNVSDGEAQGERNALRGSPKPISRGTETDDFASGFLDGDRFCPTSRGGSIAASSPSPRLPDNLESYGEVIESEDQKEYLSLSLNVGSPLTMRLGATLRDRTPSTPDASEFVIPVIVSVTSLCRMADDAPDVDATVVEMEPVTPDDASVSDTVNSSSPRPSAEDSATLVDGTSYYAGSTIDSTSGSIAVISRVDTSAATNDVTTAGDTIVLSDLDSSDCDEDDVVCLDLDQPHAVNFSQPPSGRFRRDSDPQSEPEIVDLDSDDSDDSDDDNVILEPISAIGGCPITQDASSAAGELVAALPGCATTGNYLEDETGCTAERHSATEKDLVTKDENAKDSICHVTSATGSSGHVAQVVEEVAAMKRDLENFLDFGKRLPAMISPLPTDTKDLQPFRIVAGVDDLQSLHVPVETEHLPPIPDPAGTDYLPSFPVSSETEDFETSPVLADSVILRTGIPDESPSREFRHENVSKPTVPMTADISAPIVQTTVPVELLAPIVQKTVILPPPVVQETVEMCVPLKQEEIVSVPLVVEQSPSIDSAVLGLSTPALMQQAVELSTPVEEMASDLPPHAKGLSPPAARKPILESSLVPSPATRAPAAVPVKEIKKLLELGDAVPAQPAGRETQEPEAKLGGLAVEENPSTDQSGPSTKTPQSSSLVGTVRVKPLSRMLNSTQLPPTIPPPLSETTPQSTSGMSTLATAAPTLKPISPATSGTPLATPPPSSGTLPPTSVMPPPSQASPLAAPFAPPPTTSPASPFPPSAILALSAMADYLVVLGDLFVHALERPQTLSLREDLRAYSVANQPLFRSWHEALLRTRLTRGELRESVCDAVRLRTAQQDFAFNNRLTIAMCRIADDAGYLDTVMASVALQQDRATGRVDVRFLRATSPAPPTQPAAAEPWDMAMPPPLVRLGQSRWPQPQGTEPTVSQPTEQQQPQQVPMQTVQLPVAVMQQPVMELQAPLQIHAPTAPQDLTMHRQQPDVQQPPSEVSQPSLHQPTVDSQQTNLPYQQPGLQCQEPTTNVQPSTLHQQPAPQRQELDMQPSVQYQQPHVHVQQLNVLHQQRPMQVQQHAAPVQPSVPAVQYQHTSARPPQPNAQQQTAAPPKQLSSLAQLGARLAAEGPPANLPANQPPTELYLLKRSIYRQMEHLVELRQLAPKSKTADLAMMVYREQLIAYQKLEASNKNGGSCLPESQPRSEVDHSGGERVPNQSQPPSSQADPGMETGSVQSQPPDRNPPTAYTQQVSLEAAAEGSTLQQQVPAAGFGHIDAERETARRLELQRAGALQSAADAAEHAALRRTQQLYQQQQLQFQQRQQQQRQHEFQQQQQRQQLQIQLDQQEKLKRHEQLQRQQHQELQQRRQDEQYHRKLQERKEQSLLQKEQHRQQQQLKKEQQHLLVQQQELQRLLDENQRKEQMQRLEHERQQKELQLQQERLQLQQTQRQDKSANAAWPQHQDGGSGPLPAPHNPHLQLQQLLQQQQQQHQQQQQQQQQQQLQQSHFAPPHECIRPPLMPGYYVGAPPAAPNVNPFQGNQMFSPRHHPTSYTYPTSPSVCRLNDYVTTVFPPSTVHHATNTTVAASGYVPAQVPVGFSGGTVAYATGWDGQASQTANAPAGWGDPAGAAGNSATRLWRDQFAESASEPQRRTHPKGRGRGSTGTRSSQEDSVRLMPPAIPIPRGGRGGGGGRGRGKGRRRNSAPYPESLFLFTGGTAQRANEGEAGSCAVAAAADKRRASLDSLVPEPRSATEVKSCGDLAGSSQADPTEVVPGTSESSSVVVPSPQRASPDVTGAALSRASSKKVSAASQLASSKEVGGTSRPTLEEVSSTLQDTPPDSSGLPRASPATEDNLATVSPKAEVTSSHVTTPIVSPTRRQSAGPPDSVPIG